MGAHRGEAALMGGGFAVEWGRQGGRKIAGKARVSLPRRRPGVGFVGFAAAPPTGLARVCVQSKIRKSKFWIGRSRAYAHPSNT